MMTDRQTGMCVHTVILCVSEHSLYLCLYTACNRSSVYPGSPWSMCVSVSVCQCLCVSVCVSWSGCLCPCKISRFVCCLTSQQQASVSQRWICADNLTCCHTEIEVADQSFYLTQSQYTDTRPTQAPGKVATGVPILKSAV